MGVAGKCIMISAYIIIRNLLGMPCKQGNILLGGLMYILRPDERTTPVMLYTQESFVRGEVVTKESVHRINIWLRTDGALKYMHLLKPQVLVFGGSPVKA